MAIPIQAQAPSAVQLERITDYLDRAATTGGYLDAINGTSAESMVDAKMKMGLLAAALAVDVRGAVVSVGVGQGEEVHALREVLGKDRVIYGVDLSRSALERAQGRSDRFGLDARLMYGDASAV